MTTDAKGRASRPRDRGRLPYRFTGAQVLKMVEAGLIDEDVELWDGILYRMVKGELHNCIVGQVADALRAVAPPGYHVREEKSCRHGDSSLPEPDVAIARGNKADYLPDPLPLSRMALVVEVDHHTARADGVEKPARYAEAGIPVYWHVVVLPREVRVHATPQGTGDRADYTDVLTYGIGQEIPLLVDGQDLGRLPVAGIFPPGEGDAPA